MTDLIADLMAGLIAGLSTGLIADVMAVKLVLGSLFDYCSLMAGLIMTRWLALSRF
jgi:hypothetical protein